MAKTIASIPDNVFGKIHKELKESIKGKEELIKDINAVRSAAENFYNTGQKILALNEAYKTHRTAVKNRIKQLNIPEKDQKAFKDAHKVSIGEKYVEFKQQEDLDMQQDVLQQSFETKDIENFFRAQLTYIDAIQNLMGQRMVFTFVDKDGTIYEETIKDILKEEKISNVFNYNFNSDYKLELSFNTKATKNKGVKKKLSSDIRQEALKQVYDFILQRGRYSKERMENKSKRNKELARGRSLPGDYFKYGGSKELILWKPGAKWKRAFVVSEGDIAEAYNGYAYALSYGGLDDEFFRGTIEDRINAFMTGGNYADGEIWSGISGVFGVDNQRGTYKGDFSDKENNIEYAAKTIGASFQGYSQDLKVAEKIKDLDNLSLLEVLAKDFASASKSATRNKLADKVDKEAKARFNGVTVAGQRINILEQQKAMIKIPDLKVM